MLLALSSVLLNKQYVLNKVSLNKNIHETALCIHRLKKVCDQELAETYPEFLLGTMVQVSVLETTLENATTMINKWL